MSHYYAQQPRHRPEPLALANHHHPAHNEQHRARLLSSLRSAPLPQHPQQQYHHHQHQQQYQQQQQGAGGGYPSGPSPRVQAVAEFQHAQSAYLAELAGLQRTIERQILAQQQLVLTAPAPAPARYANYAPAPHSAGVMGGRGFAQQQFAPTPVPAPQTRAAPNPLVASALARRQRQEQAQHASQTQQGQRGRGSPSPHGRGARPVQQQQQPQPQRGPRENRATPPPPPPQRASPPPPAVILSAPGEPYPDTSSSSSESGETRPSSPETSLEATGTREVKAARRRSLLDALAGLGHAVEQRKGAARARPASVGGPPALGDFARPGQQGQRTVSDSIAILSPHASAYTPLPTPPPAPAHARYAPLPVPGTASATRQPRGPPTELSPAVNFAARVRARAIESLRARQTRSGAGGAVRGVGMPSLATVQAAA